MKRAVLVGTGSIARQHVAAVAECAGRVELSAAMDLDRARCDAFCARHGIPRAYDDLGALLAAERPDLVLVCTPPASHTALAVRCLEAGAWVLCEKPLCGSLAELDSIEEAERRGGAVCSSVVQNRFSAAARRVKQLIEAGTLGRPLVGQCSTTWYRTQAYYDVAWHGRWREAFGGPTMQLGIHTMDLFLWLWPDWEEVFAHAATLDHQMEAEDVSLAVVRHASGALSSVVNSAVSPRQETRLRLDFQRATVEAVYLYRNGTPDWQITPPPAAPAARAAGAPGAPGAPGGQESASPWGELPASPAASHGAQLAELLDAMDEGRRPLVSGEEVRRTLEFCSALYKSAATRQPVRRGAIAPADPYYRSVNGHPIA
jgi:predicted dehydrogenase